MEYGAPSQMEYQFNMPYFYQPGKVTQIQTNMDMFSVTKFLTRTWTQHMDVLPFSTPKMNIR